MRNPPLISGILVTLALTGCTKPGKKIGNEADAPE
jgi:hypothetical protein